MRILTAGASDRSIVGVVEAGMAPGEIACERSADTHRHTGSLASTIERATGEYRSDMIIAGTGSVAFTGLRAGLATARVPSRVWGAPLCGVSFLEALALSDAMRELDDILAVIDTRRHEFFVLRAHPFGPDDVAVVSGPEVVARANLHAGPEMAIVTPDPDLYSELSGAVAVGCRPEYLVRCAPVFLTRKEADEDVRLDIEPWYLCRPDVHGV